MIRARPTGGMRPIVPYPQLNAGSPQARGLQAWWPLVGADRHEVLRANDAILNGSVGSIDTFVDRFGPSAEFDGGVLANRYYTMPASAYAGITTHATISGWIKLREATPIASQNGGFPICLDGATDSFYPFTDGNVYTSCFLNARVSGAPLASVNRADWHLLTVTSKPGASGWSLLQNGRVAFQSTGDATITIDQFKTIGAGALTTFTNGWIADVRVYNRCLSQPEVYALYDPRTRWDLYAVTPSRIWVKRPSAAAGRLSRLTLMGAG